MRVRKGAKASCGGRQRDRGAAAVEFAVILPVLLAVVFGIIGFGFLFAQKLALGNGARQAARYGAVANRLCADIYDQAKSGSYTVNMDETKLQIIVKVGASEATAAAKCDSFNTATDSTDPPCLGSTAGDNLYVYANYTSKVTVPLLPIPKSFPLQGTGAFRCEFS